LQAVKPCHAFHFLSKDSTAEALITYVDADKYLTHGNHAFARVARFVPNGSKIYQMAGKLTEWSQNIPTSSIERPSKIYPKWDFGFENIPSGNPGLHFSFRATVIKPFLETI
jgi:hypothetical protein